MSWFHRPYESAGARRAKMLRAVEQMKQAGQVLEPVEIEGLTIARKFWGKAWCDHLESHSDILNRLTKGRTYVRSGAVFDLKIAAGKIRAQVSGSDLYEVKIDIKPVAAERWSALRKQIGGQIATLVELLQGRISRRVMEAVVDRERGLFPSPSEMEMDCTCPDWADMCKHVAATLYGVGARLDERPELLFSLRGVDHAQLLNSATQMPAVGGGPGGRKQLARESLGAIFGIELGSVTPVEAAKPRRGGRKTGA